MYYQNHQDFYNRNHQNTNHMYELCANHLKDYVMVQTQDGNQFDGIIVDVAEDNATFAVPMDETDQMSEQMPQGDMHNQMMRIPFGYPGYGYSGYGGYPGYFYPRRRFRPLVLPLAAITAISLLPYF
ncbi:MULTISPECIES: hypothetical protein [Bacillus]|uniref:hypothetical protein n=1 Tax=Bacillus TaxID=1386 RepID=UPI000BB774DE|nr:MULTISPECIES: hypothetical protein [Bacillus]